MSQYSIVFLKINTPEYAEILTALLEAELQFEAFEEQIEAQTQALILKAYILKNELNDATLQAFLQRFEPHVWYLKTEFLENKNWNEIWENDFKPVYISNKIVIKAPFHNISQIFDYEIVIEPKMAFGTGHHATTALLMEYMLQLPIAQKTVLDFGCGTGILAILAKKMGSNYTLAIDYDEVCCASTLENITLNNTPTIEVLQGSWQHIPTIAPFDIIFANVNFNVLVQALPFLFNALAKNGFLLLSGILKSDETNMLMNTQTLGLTHISTIFDAEYNTDWIGIVLQKIK